MKFFEYSYNNQKVFQIPALTDNYIYIITEDNKAWVIDPTLDPPVQKFLTNQNLELQAILNTHHHPDHIGGNRQLVKNWDCPVYGFGKDQKRIPHISELLLENQEFQIGNFKAQVLFIPGHTLGHIAYYFKEQNWLFSGDTLFSIGCGYLFEGTAQQMQNSLNIIRNLPDETLVFCSHEYTQSNLDFALSLFPEDRELNKKAEVVTAKRSQQQPTVPMTLLGEKKTNPFLRWDDTYIRKVLNMKTSEDWQIFGEIRRRKNNF